MSRTVRFAKGHGTRNDFVLLDDRDGAFELTAAAAAALADRRSGVGGDGVIRIGPTASAPDAHVRDQAAEARWFMDYRNADGSISSMCGNGVRVVTRYLQREGLVGESFRLATRGGAKQVRVEGDQICVDMGHWRLVDPDAAAENGVDALVHVPGHEPFSALRLDLGNPHTVVALPPAVDLDGLDLTAVPAVRPHPAEGTNVEFVVPLAPGRLRMRVHERGVGETESCGTGACAAAIATHLWAGGAEDATSEWTVDVPGGTLRVRLLGERRVELAGPAVIVADGSLTLP